MSYIHFREKNYGTLRYKNYETSLANLIREEFGYIGGDKVVDLFVKEVKKLTEAFYVNQGHMKPGQLLWVAVDLNDKGKRKPMRKSKLKPVKLSILTPEDIEDLANNRPLKDTFEDCLGRIYTEAYKQGGSLSLCDGSAIFHIDRNIISKHIQRYERKNQTIVHRRGIDFDLGTTLTHKEVILRDYLRGVPTPDNSRKKWHSTLSVDAYINKFERINALYPEHTVDEIAYFTGIGKKAVKQYVKFIEENKDRLNPKTNKGGDPKGH